MRTGLLLGLILLLSCGAGTRAPREGREATPVDAKSTPEREARAFIEQLARHQWLEATKQFDAKMTEVMPPSKLEDTWLRVETEVGPWVAVESSKVETKNNVRAAMVTCRFARHRELIRVVFAADDRISGLWFRPVAEDLDAGARTLIEAAADDWKPPSYAKIDAFAEVNVQVGRAPDLPGILSIPKGGGPFPAVVLVHGSGPSDADETVGAIKVFKDIAFGLASHGVAVLRYVKRSRQDPRGIVTQKEEVIDAANAAIDLLRLTAGIDPARVFLVGHSQGGYLAPRIARENHKVAGLVILAGPTRPLQDSLVEQLGYLSSLDPSNVELKSEIGRAEQFKRVVEDPGLRAEQIVVSPFGNSMTGAYFLDMRDYHPEKIAAKLSCPLLVLQGERDYQVTKTDFERWQGALGKQSRATLRLYPLLNHLFVAGSGVPSPDEYQRPGQVDEQIVLDIAAWVARQPAKTEGG